MNDIQTIRELTELAIVAGASMFVCLTFVWWQRTVWMRTMDEAQADAARKERDASEAHRVELRQLDAYNAAERRRLEDEIANLKAELTRMQAQRESDWQILRRVLAERGIPVPQAPPAINIVPQAPPAINITATGDTNIGGPVVGRDMGRP